MASALQLLRGERYELGPSSYPAEGMSMEPPPMAQPSMPQTQAKPSYAELLVDAGVQRGTGPMPMEQGGGMARMVADRPEQTQGAMPQPGSPEWMTPERKKMYEKAKRAATNYRAAVDTRRQKRKQSGEYSKLYNQMQAERGKVDQIESMMATYKDMFRPDDPRTERMIRQQMQHFETAERLTNDLRQRLQKQGIKLGPKDNLPEDPWGGGGEDEQFDRFIMQGYNEALMSDPYQ